MDFEPCLEKSLLDPGDPGSFSEKIHWLGRVFNNYINGFDGLYGPLELQLTFFFFLGSMEGNTQDLISMILLDASYSSDIFLRDPVDPGSCSLYFSRGILWILDLANCFVV